MIYDKMDSLRIPDLLNAHLTENLDRQRSGTVLSHGHVHWQNGNLARKVDLPASVSFDANDLLSKRKRIIVENRLGQISREAGRKLPLLKMKLKLLAAPELPEKPDTRRKMVETYPPFLTTKFAVWH